jgi:hypothetical protein
MTCFSIYNPRQTKELEELKKKKLEVMKRIVVMEILNA